MLRATIRNALSKARPRSRTGVGQTTCRALATTPDLPSEVDAVIIGGGSLGASVAYHMQAKGMKTILLERHQLTAGTTWHTAGMLWRLRPSDTDIELHTYTRDMCIKMEEEFGINSWVENGGLFVANNKERLAEYERLYTLGQYYGVPSQMLTPKETQELYPILNVSDVYGSMYSPTDGTIDPAGVVQQYKKAATKIGSRFVENCPITGIETETYSFNGEDRRRVVAVEAAGQRIKTNWVVNCTGAWANEIANMVGMDIPLRAMKHAYIVTDKIEGVHPGLPNMRDHDLSIYFKTQGDSLALGGYEQNPEFWKDVDPQFSFGLFDLDWDTFGQNMEGHIQRCPVIEETGIQSTVCGPEAFTPDHKPLVGPDVALQGFFHCCGFNSMGMMLGGGVGREVASWVTEGAATVDMFGMDVSRFHPSTVGNNRWVEDRTHESYAKTYAIVFPHDEPVAGRQMRKSAVYDALLKRGCVWQSRQSFERPGWFDPELVDGAAECKEYDFYGAYQHQDNIVTGLGRLSLDHHEDHPYLKAVEEECTFGWGKSMPLVAKECFAVRNGVAVFDHSYFGKFLLEGPEAGKAADWIATAKMVDREIGSVAYTALCNERGGVMADLTFTKLEENKFYIAAGGSTSTHDWRWITKQIEKGGFNATMKDATDDYTMLSVQGPYSRQVLKEMADQPLDDDSYMPFSTARDMKIAGHDVMVLRLTFVGECGYELHIPSKSAVAVYEALMKGFDKLAAQGVPVANSGYRAIDTLSAEKGYRHWHADLTNRDTPFEAGIGFAALAKLKTDIPFLGREALEKQRAEGLKRKLICLTLEEERTGHPLHGRETIWRNGECIGFVRSTAYGFSIGKQIAYGYVDAPGGQPLKPKDFTAWLKEGSFEFGDRGKKRAAKLQVKTPFDPKNARIKGDYPEPSPMPKHPLDAICPNFL